MKNEHMIALFVAGGILFYILYKRSRTAFGTVGTRSPYQPNGYPQTLGRYTPAGSTGIDQMMNNLGNLFKNLTGQKSSGGTGAGAGASGGPQSLPSKATGPGQQTGNLLNDNAQAKNFGSYVGLDGQLYNIDGQALDDNGNPIPGVFDNSGTGPAGAGINQGAFVTDPATGNIVWDASAPGSIATNPLEYGDPNNPADAMYGVVIPLNTPGLVTTPSQEAMTPGQQLLADAQAQDAIGSTRASAEAPLASASADVATMALTVPDPTLPAADASGTANRVDPGVAPDSMLASAPNSIGYDPNLNTSPNDPTVDPSSNYGSTGTPMDGAFDTSSAPSIDPTALYALAVDPYSTGGDVASWNDNNVDFGF